MNGKQKKLLLIDDSNDSLDMLEMYLYQDYKIVTADNGFEGLNKAMTESPDCIVTDIMMPIMDGINFFNNLKNNRDTNKIPVIAVTSFTKEHSIKSLFSIGFSDVIAKPVSRIDIVNSVAKAVQPTKSGS